MAQRAHNLNLSTGMECTGCCITGWEGEAVAQRTMYFNSSSQRVHTEITKVSSQGKALKCSFEVCLLRFCPPYGFHIALRGRSKLE